MESKYDKDLVARDVIPFQSMERTGTNPWLTEYGAQVFFSASSFFLRREKERRGLTCDDAAGFFLWNAVAVWIPANASFRFALMLCGVGRSGLQSWVGWLVGRDDGGGGERKVRLTRGSILPMGAGLARCVLISGFYLGSCF